MNIVQIIEILREATKKFTPPLSQTIIEEFGKDPFLILISCLLSLRARDTMTIQVCRVLFKKVRTPHKLAMFPLKELEDILRPIGFYKNKAKTIKKVSLLLIEQFNGKVPSTREALLLLPGIGPKTTALVLGLAFDQAAICVDVHVHRISNRLGIIKTKTVEETEKELMKLIPKKYWIEWNYLIVMWGQNICVPISPKCSTCALKPVCKRIGVTTSR